MNSMMARIMVPELPLNRVLFPNTVMKFLSITTSWGWSMMSSSGDDDGQKCHSRIPPTSNAAIMDMRAMILFIL